MTQVKNFTITAILFSACMVFSNALAAQEIKDNDIKGNVTAIDNALSRLIKLEPKSFTYINSRFNNLPLDKGKQYGFIADDMANVFPELVKDKKVQYMFGKNAYRTAKMKTVDEASLIPFLVASIKEQQQQIDKLKQELEALKNTKAVVTN